MEQLNFTAEVKEVSSKKMASLDVGYRVVLYTSDPSVLALGALEGDALLKVAVTVEGES